MSSRRRGFDTSLTSSSSSKPDGRSNAEVPPPIPAPKASEPTATVPTETTSGTATPQSVVAENEMTQEELDDTSTCFICAEPITFWSTGVCGHKTCHVCALRLRIFYKKTDCTYCKTAQPSLVFSRSPTTPFPSEHTLRPSAPAAIAAAQARAEKEKDKSERWDRGLTLPGKLNMNHFEFKDEKTSIVFEDEDMMGATLLLLRFNCPHSDCAHMADGWTNLNKHTLQVHGVVLCTLCCRSLSRFSHEQALFPPQLLAIHDPSRLHRGQRPPRPKGTDIELVKTWDAPHPMCEFCHEAFFGPDELFAHMRTKHDECFVCKDLGERNVYFQNYAKLEAHFNSDHFPCRQEVCLEQKFVVFGSELDLRAHTIEVHKNIMSSRQQAQSRQINVDFSDTSRSAGPSRQHHGQGRGFTMQARGGDAPQQQQLAQHAPMGDAQAAQARRQAQTDRQEESNRRRRAFNTNLTETQREPERELASAGRGSGSNTPREDVDEATAMRHAALISRVSFMVNDSENKMTSFRAAIRAFKNTESTAKGMIDTIYNVLDQDAPGTVNVVKQIGQIFEEDGNMDKAKDILEAINGFRAQQEQQFPSLAGSSGTGSNYAGITSGQILRAKNTTHTFGRSGSSRSVWDRVEAAAASRPAPPPATHGANQRIIPGSRAALVSSSAFPGLGATPTPGPNANGARSSGTPHSTPWASGGAGSSSRAPPVLAGPQIRSVNYPVASATTASKSGKTPKPPSHGAFPSLPSSKPTMSAQERKALFSKPSARERDDSNPVPPSGNGWGEGGATEGMEGLNLNGNGGEGQQQGGGKKKGKSKQILFSVSARPQ